MRKHSQLHGLLFYPCSLDKREHEKTIFSAKGSIRSDFKETYENHMAIMKIIAESAKIYILNNYKKIKNWGDIKISIVDRSNTESFYYKY